MEKKIEDLKKMLDEPSKKASEPADEVILSSLVHVQDEDEVNSDLPNYNSTVQPQDLVQKSADTRPETTMIGTMLLRHPQFVPPTHPPAVKESSRSSVWLTHLEHHRQLIEKLLEGVNSSRYAIDHGVRYRLHDSVLDLHWQDWSPLRYPHEEVLRGLLAQNPILARH